jgi:hypothetical protein
MNHLEHAVAMQDELFKMRRCKTKYSNKACIFFESWHGPNISESGANQQAIYEQHLGWYFAYKEFGGGFVDGG